MLCVMTALDKFIKINVLLNLHSYLNEIDDLNEKKKEIILCIRRKDVD